MTIEKIEEQHRRFRKKIRRRHPDKSSDCRALLAEVVGGTNLKERGHCAFQLGLIKCKIGLRQLEKLIDEFEIRFDPDNLNSPESNMLSYLLWAVGTMDTPQSHAVLKKVIDRSKEGWVRGYALTEMAWEKKCFELDYVLRFLSTDEHHYVAKSAMYALKFKYATKRPADARRRLKPFLTHEDPMMRVYAVETLNCSPKHRDLLEAMRDDPDAGVRDAVVDGLNSLRD